MPPAPPSAPIRMKNANRHTSSRIGSRNCTRIARGALPDCWSTLTTTPARARRLQQRLRLRARDRVGGPVFELRWSRQRRVVGSRVELPGAVAGRPRRPWCRRKSSRPARSPARGRLERDLDAIVVVEQRRGRDLFVFGQREHAADRQFRAVAGGTDRPQQHEERDRQRDRGDRQEQRDLVAEHEPAHADRDVARPSRARGCVCARGPSAPADASRGRGRGDGASRERDRSRAGSRVAGLCALG